MMFAILGLKIYMFFTIKGMYHVGDDGVPCEKMATILPIGQWYAPSAVINDAW